MLIGFLLFASETDFDSSLNYCGRVMVEQDGLLVCEDFLASAPKLFDQAGIVMSNGCSLELPPKAEASTDVLEVPGLVLLGCRHCLGYKNPD